MGANAYDLILGRRNGESVRSDTLTNPTAPSSSYLRGVGASATAGAGAVDAER